MWGFTHCVQWSCSFFAWLKLFILYTMFIYFCCCCFLINYIFVEYTACDSKNLTNEEECEAIVCLIWWSQSLVLYLIEQVWKHLKRQLAGKKKEGCWWQIHTNTGRMGPNPSVSHRQFSRFNDLKMSGWYQCTWLFY